MKSHKYSGNSLLLLFSLALAACAGTPDITPTENDIATALAAVVTQPAEFPTEIVDIAPTPEPVYVAVVNGVGITETSYLVSLAQFEAAQAETGLLLAADKSASQLVLESLVQRMLLAQGARTAGYLLDEAMLDARIAQLVEQVGGQEALLVWQAANGYTEASFREDLRLEMEAAWMRDEIIASVPESMPQVKARQIFFYDAYSAQRIYGQLQNGTAFQQAVDNNDPKDLGNLGWFPQGYLFSPEIEAAAFALEKGQYSEVIETEIGFHIVEVLERADDRPLSADARLTLGLAALDIWLAEKSASSLIEIYIP